jgi:Xaa-Pro aminopeptidase
MALASPFAETGAAALQGSFGAPAATSPFEPAVYRERREKLMGMMKGGIGIVYSAGSLDTSNPVAALAPQESDFSYLTGIQDEAGAAIVLAPAERTYREFLLLAPRNPEVERYEGVRLPLGQDIRQRTGFERIMRTTGLGRLAVDLSSRSPELHYLGRPAEPEASVPKALDLYQKITGRVPGTRVVNSSHLLRRMRTAKEPREIALIRQAVRATERGLNVAMKRAAFGMQERELKNIIEAEFRAAGAQGLAFPSIVAAGRASAVLHYTGGDRTISRGELILCDVGAAVGGYAADITRTFPIDGRFTPEQRSVYEVVLRAQETAMRSLRAGAVFEDLNRSAAEVIRAAGHGDDFWHGLGHFLGLQVHDVGSQVEPLPVGAALTIEPGIYLPEKGFGIRIEDDFIVTESGFERLSRNTPRTPSEIEAFLARS